MILVYMRAIVNRKCLTAGDCFGVYKKVNDIKKRNIFSCYKNTRNLNLKILCLFILEDIDCNNFKTFQSELIISDISIRAYKSAPIYNRIID
jgi:hypothetical protein